MRPGVISYGGVSVADSGTFTMEGGTISKNTASYTTGSAYGGGVYVYSGSTFTKTNGVITGYGSDTVNGNKVVRVESDGSEAIQNSRSHAVYISQNQRLNNTVSASHNLDSSAEGADGGWVE